MTKQVYQTAQGQSVDLGAIVLKNEHVRAVGNMNVNARGDKIDGDNRIVDERSQQTQRQTERTTVPATNVATTTVHTSNSHAKRSRAQALAQSLKEEQPDDQPVEATKYKTVVGAPNPERVPSNTIIDDDTSGEGGLAAAIARSKVIEQEKLKTPKQAAQEKPGVTRI
jgi:hypothetical protein